MDSEPTSLQLAIIEFHGDGTTTHRHWVVKQSLADSVAAQMGPPYGEALFSADQMAMVVQAGNEIGPVLLGGDLQRETDR